ncbi:hypothetical protein A2Z33_00280 [Candidatus Gottesmanbacteria bacterium RBG_16_52_11]|uniref:Uncharacterized protein n=1 Tax=Candidatus Gottesmanbacteria bacterium RBG_16_52_11 TaxID=1798374 RepID=A0A1F5YPE6_9BACT|nr:MAG: hypothetical protein A2Z33_00280 [Candidatus Gottesmanbacteria bacterium RBG_16_52_11]
MTKVPLSRVISGCSGVSWATFSIPTEPSVLRTTLSTAAPACLLSCVVKSRNIRISSWPGGFWGFMESITVSRVPTA